MATALVFVHVYTSSYISSRQLAVALAREHTPYSETCSCDHLYPETTYSLQHLLYHKDHVHVAQTWLINAGFTILSGEHKLTLIPDLDKLHTPFSGDYCWNPSFF